VYVAIFKNFLLGGLALAMVGCSGFHKVHDQGKVLPGTTSAVVGIYIDIKGYPQATVDQVKVSPGDRIVFVGPDKFDILFKNQRSPVGALELSSSRSVITIDIPRDIFERSRTSNNIQATDGKTLVYDYGIRVNGKVTDPRIIVVPQ
jgi:hypothetical protein